MEKIKIDYGSRDIARFVLNNGRKIKEYYHFKNEYLFSGNLEDERILSAYYSYFKDKNISKDIRMKNFDSRLEVTLLPNKNVPFGYKFIEPNLSGKFGYLAIWLECCINPIRIIRGGETPEALKLPSNDFFFQRIDSKIMDLKYEVLERLKKIKTDKKILYNKDIIKDTRAVFDR